MIPSLRFFAAASVILLVGVAALYGRDRDKMDPSSVHGRIQFVTSFPDYKVKSVTSFPDLKVKIVKSLPGDGEWQIVDSFPDFKIQMVDTFPDFTVEFTNGAP